MMLPVQNLPYLVVEQIIRYAVAYETNKWNPIQKLKCSELKCALSLASVSRSWRHTVLADLYQDVIWCEINCSRCLMCACCHHTLPRLLRNAISMGLVDRVKTLSLHVRASDIFNGEALLKLCTLAADKMTLSNVGSLAVSFDATPPEAYPADDVCFENTHQFCNRLRKLLPNACAIDMADIHPTSSWLRQQQYLDLFSRLMNGMTSVAGMRRMFGGLPTNSSNSMPLRSIGVMKTVNDKHAGELIRHHSGTLEHITLQTWNSGAYPQMIFDESGGLVTYPRVRALQLETRSCGWVGLVDTSAFGETPLFPVLEVLKYTGSYPFTTAILIQGNEQTLREITMCLDKHAIEAIGHCGILTLGRYSALDYVKVIDDYYLPRDLFDRCVQIGAALGRNASVFKCNLSYTSWFRYLELTQSDFSPTLRVLDLGSVQFTVPQAARVLIMLPFLCQLSISLEQSGELRYTDKAHHKCLGRCQVDKDSDELSLDIFGSGVGLERISDMAHVDFLHSHLEMICADLGSLNELRRQYASMCPRLCSLRFDHVKPFNLTELCRATIIFTQLCTNVKRVEFTRPQLGRNCVFMSSDIPSISY